MIAADPASLAAAVRGRLGPAPETLSWPLVSIVVVDRDGVSRLPRLLAGLAERTDYPRLELVLVENGAGEDSLEQACTVQAPIAIAVIANPHEESFSDACNQGARLATGSLLLFLDGDVEPFEPGWLRELVACLRAHDAGAVSSTLVCRDRKPEAGFEHGYRIEQRGFDFREGEDGMLHPARRGRGADPLDGQLGQDEEAPALSAACLLVDRGPFERVGGFTHGFIHGSEDIDLCLKLRNAGHPVLCSGRSLATHDAVTVCRRPPLEQERERELGNRRLLWERWGPRLRREYELARRDDGEWPLGFCLVAADPEAAVGAGLEALAAVLRARGYRCLLLEGERAEDPLGLEYEIAVHLHGRLRYVPRAGRLNVLWSPAGDARRDRAGCPGFDLVLEGGAGEPERICERILERVADQATSPPVRSVSA